MPKSSGCVAAWPDVWSRPAQRRRWCRSPAPWWAESPAAFAHPAASSHSLTIKSKINIFFLGGGEGGISSVQISLFVKKKTSWLYSIHKIMVLIRGSRKQKDVVYLGWPTAPLLYEPKCGIWWGDAGLSQLVQLCTWSPNNLWRCNSKFNIWF